MENIASSTPHGILSTIEVLSAELELASRGVPNKSDEARRKLRPLFEVLRYNNYL